MREFSTKHLLNLGEILQGRNLITVSVGFSGTPVILSLDGTPDYRGKWGGFKDWSDRINNYRIHYLSEGVFKHVDLAPTRENYRFVQPLGSEQWLVVRPWANGYDDNNGHIYSDGGERIHSFYAGEGIVDVQVNETGQIWISFLDQGCFCGRTVIKPGLVCLDETGKLVFHYTRKSDQIEEMITDCYAMNVTSTSDIWIYYYTEFPLVQISNFQIHRRWFPMPIKGSHAFAVNKDYHALFDGDYGDYALFAGGYVADTGADKDGSLLLVSLDTMTFEELIPVDKSGKAMKSFQAFGRGSRLFLYTDDTLSVVRLDMDDW